MIVCYRWSGYVADNKIFTFQTGLEHVSKKNENNLIFHYHNYDRQYENSGYHDQITVIIYRIKF